MSHLPLASTLALLLAAAASSCSADETAATGTLTVRLGYHPLEGDVTATFVPLSNGQALPVLMGGQGAVMCIVAAELAGFVPEGSFTVDVALRKSNGDPWAFPRVRLEPVWSEDGTAYFANVWLIFSDPPWIRPWEGTTARLELTATSLGKDGVGGGIVSTAALDVVLTPSDAVAGSRPPPEPDVPESLFEDTIEPEDTASPDDTFEESGDVTEDGVDVQSPRSGEE